MPSTHYDNQIDSNTRKTTVKIHDSSNAQKMIGAVVISVGALLSGSALTHAFNNLQNLGSRAYEETANTPFTALRGIRKIDNYDGPAYAGDPSDGSYLGYDIIRNGAKSDGFIDNLVGLPGNFSIFLGGIMIAGIGRSLTKEEKKSIEDKIIHALKNRQKLSFSDGINTATIDPIEGGKFRITIGTRSLDVYMYQKNIDAIIRAYKAGTIMNILP